MSDEKTVKVRLLPLHNIGGYGNAGDVVIMPTAVAKQYVKEGYVEILSKRDGEKEGEPVPSVVLGADGKKGDAKQPELPADDGEKKKDAENDEE